MIWYGIYKGSRRIKSVNPKVNPAQVKAEYWAQKCGDSKYYNENVMLQIMGERNLTIQVARETE